MEAYYLWHHKGCGEVTVVLGCVSECVCVLVCVHVLHLYGSIAEEAQKEAEIVERIEFTPLCPSADTHLPRWPKTGREQSQVVIWICVSRKKQKNTHMMRTYACTDKVRQKEKSRPSFTSKVLHIETYFSS